MRKHQTPGTSAQAQDPFQSESMSQGYENVYIHRYVFCNKTSLVAQTVKASAYNAGDLGSIPGSGRSPGKGNGNHSSTLAWKIPRTDGGAWWATVHGVTKSRTRLSDFTFYDKNIKNNHEMKQIH